jgi:outer membrane protein assembly factor BamB
MFRKADLHVEWVGTLPMGRAGSVKRIFYHNGKLLTLDESNTLIAMDGKNGGILWSTIIGSSHAICSQENFFQDNLLFMVGNTFVQVRLIDGKIIQKLEIKIPVSTSIARTEDRLFIGSFDKRFYCLRASDGVPLWQSVCPDEPTGTVTVSDGKVYFVCRDGTLYISKTDERSLVWKVPTAGKVPGVTVKNGICYLPSTDTALYCIQADSQTLIKKHLAGGSLVEPPALTAEAIYQPIEHAALLCLNRKDHSPRWQLDVGYQLLAENGLLTYAITLDQELSVMNNRTGKRVLSFYLPNFTLCAPNTEDAYIFLATKEGTILTLKPNK